MSMRLNTGLFVSRKFLCEYER